MIGIIIAKENSNRFKGKNYYNYNGKPLFWHNVEVLKEANCEVYVATNSNYIKDYCEKRMIKVVWRGCNVSKDEQPLFEVLKWAYNCIDKSDIVVNILANTINVTKDDILKAVKILKKHNLTEVRSFDGQIENGLMVLDPAAFLKNELSVYQGMIKTKSKEIHYESDLFHS